MDLDRRAVLAGSAGAIALSLTRAMAAEPMEVETRMIPLPSGHKVWTQRVGRGETKLLLLHGGPGFSHDYLRCFADFLPQAGFEIYFYDQLGCGQSDRPEDAALWTLPRYLEEVEAVREGLGLDRFVLFGHSWGGILGIEYALHYPERLRGFILSNMTASFADYGAYTAELKARLPAPVRRRLAALEAEGKVATPEYGEILQRELYTRYICRLDPWPQPLLKSFEGANLAIYEQMQGPNEFAITGNLKDWDRWADLPRIAMPTLVMGARYDEMNPQSIRRESALIPGGRLFISERGSHLSMWDDQAAYFAALTAFLRTLAA